MPEQWAAQRYDRLKDRANAAIWWERCAQGKWSTFPQRTLAERYRDGKGVEKDLLTAYFWANVASNPTPTGPDYDAVRLRDEVAKQLSPEQLAEGQQRSWNWRSGKEA